MSFMPIKVSIIVPVYNVEPYLRRCIDSILAQTFTDFELILVDDGSPDNCPAICDEYAEKDSRIMVIHKENGGVSSARNAGLDKCIGKYVVFCDSDDYIGTEYISDLLSAVSDKNTDDFLVISNWFVVKPDGSVKSNPLKDYLIDLDCGTAEEYMYLFDKYVIYGPYCKLFSTQIIQDHRIRYNESLKSAEDFDFNIRYIENIKFIRTIPKSQYYYRVGYKVIVSCFIDDSSIFSSHIMAKGLIGLARRMGIYQDMFVEISKRVAEKHWLSRLPRVFVYDRSVNNRKRREMYLKLRGDDEYREVCRAGIVHLPISRLTKICARIDKYYCWQSYYVLYRLLHTRRL